MKVYKLKHDIPLINLITTHTYIGLLPKHDIIDLKRVTKRNTLSLYSKLLVKCWKQNLNYYVVGSTNYRGSDPNVEYSTDPSDIIFIKFTPNDCENIIKNTNGEFIDNPGYIKDIPIAQNIIEQVKDVHVESDNNTNITDTSVTDIFIDEQEEELSNDSNKLATFFTKRELACILLKVPNSGERWLDALITTCNNNNIFHK